MFAHFILNIDVCLTTFVLEFIWVRAISDALFWNVIYSGYAIYSKLPTLSSNFAELPGIVHHWQHTNGIIMVDGRRKESYVPCIRTINNNRTKQTGYHYPRLIKYHPPNATILVNKDHNPGISDVAWWRSNCCWSLMTIDYGDVIKRLQGFMLSDYETKNYSR